MSTPTTSGATSPEGAAPRGDRSIRGLRAAGLSIGLLGATTLGGVAGWFTLAGQASETPVVTTTRAITGDSVIASASTGAGPSLPEESPVGQGNGNAHTRSGGS